MLTRLLSSSLLICSLYIPTQAQDRKVTGLVTFAENNAPVSGVWVAIKNTTVNTYTDSTGHYAITVPANATLIYSSIGTVIQEIAVGKHSQVNVKLVDQNRPAPKPDSPGGTSSRKSGPQRRPRKQ